MSGSFLSIPGDELFWAVLTVPALPRSARRGAQILNGAEEFDGLFAEFLPVDIDAVKTAYVVLDAGRLLAAAVGRERLALIDPGVTVVTPATVPGRVLAEPEAGGLATNINFLWGDMEAAPVIGAKRRATGVAAAVIVLLAAAAVVGLERRTAALRVAASVHQAQATAALKDLYHKATVDAGLVALDQDLLRLTRTRAPRTTAGTDAADALQSLLAAWPRTQGTVVHKLRTESLTATPDNLTLTVALEDRAEATPLSDALRAIAGWKLFQPQFTAAPPSSGGSSTPPSTSGGVLSLRLAADATAGTKQERSDAGGAR